MTSYLAACEPAVSHFVRGFILFLRVSVVAPSLERSSSARPTWTQTQLLPLLYVQHSRTRCSSPAFSLSVNQKVSIVRGGSSMRMKL